MRHGVRGQGVDREHGKVEPVTIAVLRLQVAVVIPPFHVDLVGGVVAGKLNQDLLAEVIARTEVGGDDAARAERRVLDDLLDHLLEPGAGQVHLEVLRSTRG